MTWGDWRDEYRFGAFYLFPPPGVVEFVDDLRAALDPQSHAICQAHISVSEPLPRQFADGDRLDLERALIALGPFTVHYGPIVCYPPHPGVVYAITPEAPFRALQDAVHAMPLFAGVKRRREHIPPHMTIAEFITWERTEELVAELSGTAPIGQFRCDRIELAVPDEAFRFQRTLLIPLRSPSGAGPQD